MPQIRGVSMSRIERCFCWFDVRVSLLGELKMGELKTYLLQNLGIPDQTSESYKHVRYKTLPQNYPSFLELSNSSCIPCGLTHISFKNLQNLKPGPLKGF